VITADIAAVLRRHPGARRDSLIPILQEIQQTCGGLSREAIIETARHLGLPAGKVYGVATFYDQFRFRAPGKFHVQVCRGTGCHVNGSALLLESLAQAIGVKPGETARDGLFSLEVVTCLGACGHGPVLAVNGEFHAGVTSDSVRGILDSYRGKVAADGKDRG